jgi:hypothetical protein
MEGGAATAAMAAAVVEALPRCWCCGFTQGPGEG